MIKLIVFDVDGTLAKSHTLEVLPGVKDFFRLVFQRQCAGTPKVAIATNQGGVGFRYWMEKDHFGHPSGYPTEPKVEERMEKLVAELGENKNEIPVYISYAYINREGKWGPIPPEKEHDPRWQQTWRKPNPGMLQQAMQDLNSTPEETMYVGDRSEDMAAAKAAGCAFENAGDFFARSWCTCEGMQAFLEGNDHARKD